MYLQLDCVFWPHDVANFGACAGEKPFTCSICQKAYARKSHLNVHYRVHTGERPFVCHHCDKDFTEKRFLNDHLQTAHNGADGPLRCPNCCREFAYKTSLKQHLKKLMCERNINRGGGAGAAAAVVPPAGGGSNGVMKQFQCPFCDKSYSWKQTLKQVGCAAGKSILDIYISTESMYSTHLLYTQTL
jgi:uncharacterized Zn-finger protein